ncbi:hypothetical protein C2845_PMPSC011943 [Panicum miliaceum]|uniref:Uncharacterized protein n=1 Tax=Panicum miliaceum TaxID=4540 RepID=A0A3L6PB63_PANMI|nr:hypothetical protein C2845_PMPSC011943 [Panicum miliaceum]
MALPCMRPVPAGRPSLLLASRAVTGDRRKLLASLRPAMSAETLARTHASGHDSCSCLPACLVAPSTLHSYRPPIAPIIFVFYRFVEDKVSSPRSHRAMCEHHLDATIQLNKTISADWFAQGFASLGGHVPPRQQQQGGGASLLAPPPYTLYHHLHHHGASYGGDSAALAAAWQQQRGSKGTGVFIPRSTPGAAHTRKKGKNRGAAAARAARAGANALVAGGPAKKRA